MDLYYCSATRPVADQQRGHWGPGPRPPSSKGPPNHQSVAAKKLIFDIYCVNIQRFNKAIIDVLVINVGPIAQRNMNFIRLRPTGVYTLTCGVQVNRQGKSSDIMGPSSGSVRSEQLYASDAPVWN